jgi:hypothetical protein
MSSKKSSTIAKTEKLSAVDSEEDVDYSLNDVALRGWVTTVAT